MECTETRNICRYIAGSGLGSVVLRHWTIIHSNTLVGIVGCETHQVLSVRQSPAEKSLIRLLKTKHTAIG